MMDWEHPFGRDRGGRETEAAPIPEPTAEVPVVSLTATAAAAKPESLDAEPEDWRVKHALDYLRSYQPRPVALGKLPAVVEAAFRSAGIQVEATWEPSPVALDGDVALEAVAAPEDDLETAPVEDVSPCPQCGSLELSWDCEGQPHCMVCEPARLQQAQGLIELAGRLRRRGLPKKSEAAC